MSLTLGLPPLAQTLIYMKVLYYFTSSIVSVATVNVSSFHSPSYKAISIMLNKSSKKEQQKNGILRQLRDNHTVFFFLRFQGFD